MLPDFSIDLPDRPGELARLAARFREADVNLIGLWGYSSARLPSNLGAAEGAKGGGEGHARFYCVPESAEQFRGFIESTELMVAEGTTFYLEGEDHGGALVERLDRIAAAGINLRAIEAMRAGDRFGCFIWAAPGDWGKLAEVLDG